VKSSRAPTAGYPIILMTSVSFLTDGAEIGNQAVSIDIAEPVVVSNAPQCYPLRYYDTPFRYFNPLQSTTSGSR
jgi:hypothetical protein